jgi:hypothetical protein
MSRFTTGWWRAYPESNRDPRFRRTLPCALGDRLMVRLPSDSPSSGGDMVGPVRFELTSLRLKGECRYPLCDEPKKW